MIARISPLSNSRAHARHGLPGVRAVLALLTTGLLLYSAPLAAQELQLAKPIAPAQGARSTAPAPADSLRPGALRSALLSIHGFSRAELEAASTQVPEQLRALAQDASQPKHLRRRAAKALRLFPSQATFDFLAQQLPAAEAGLDLQYALQLGDYAADHPAEVRDLLRPLLRSGAVALQSAAIRGAQALPDGGRALLQQEADAVQNPALRSALERAVRSAP